MIFVLMPSARGQRMALGAFDAITQQVFEPPPGVALSMQHTSMVFPRHGHDAEEQTPEEMQRKRQEALAALEPAPALRLDLERLPLDANVPSAFLCPISLALMHDPVVAADGHSYERSYIERWLTEKMVSPKNNTALACDTLFPNYNLRTAILQWFELSAEQPAVFCESPVAVE